MKTFEQLQKEWGDSTCGRSIERFIYDYFEAERPKAWNEAIDEVITMLNEDVQHGYFEMYWNILKENLEKLKHKQP